MANDFKRFVKKDIGTGEGASGSTVYTVPSSSSTAMESIVIGITIANKSTAGITCDVFLDALGGASDDVYIVKYQCCFDCFVNYVDNREERWLSGWRPEKADKGDK